MPDLFASYLQQVRDYAGHSDSEFALQLENTDGTIHGLLQAARSSRRTGLLDSVSIVEDGERRFRNDGATRRLDVDEHRRVAAAFEAYLDTLPDSSPRDQAKFFAIKDIVGKKGFGIGSAGLPAYNVLIEGRNEAIENDIVLIMKQGNRAAASRVVTDERVRAYFHHDGHRTVISQRALQEHTDHVLGYTTIDGIGFVVSELSPYTLDLQWDNLTEPSEIEPVLVDLGRATAKVHCSSDEDSEQNLVTFQTEEAILEVVAQREGEFIDDIVNFSLGYANTVRADHALFVEAFRENNIVVVPSV